MKKHILFLLFCIIGINSANAQILPPLCDGEVVCQGSTTTSDCLLDFVVTPLGLGTWSSSNPSVASVNSSGVITGVSGGTATISYSVSVLFIGLTIYRAPVTVNPTPSAAPSYAMPACVGGTLSLSANDAGGSNTYAWTGPNSFSAAARNPSISDVTTAASGTYTLVVTSGAGCTGTYTLSVTVNPRPTAEPTYDARVCTGGTLSLMANASGAATYAWTGPNGFSATTADPTIAGLTSAAIGTYTLTVTSAAGCSSTYTLGVTFGGTLAGYSVSVSQTAPFALTGDKVHTYCANGGLTLEANLSPELPSGVTYTWTGPVSGSSTATVFTPTFTPTAAVAVHPYTLTASYNGCNIIVRDTIVVPVAGCSPCDYYTVNKSRELSGLSAVPGCSDCNTMQPFHTIVSGRLTTTNVADDANYYIARNVICKKPSLNNNNFFMGSRTIMFIDTVTAVDINHCHFFSSNTCDWVGILVIPGKLSAGRLSINNNTLIENTGGTTYEGLFPGAVVVMPNANGYYSSGMADILNSDGVIYNKVYDGVAIYQYQPSIAATSGGARLPFTVKNSVFTMKEFARAGDAGATAADHYPFAWPTVAQLRTITASGTIPTYGADAYRNAPTTTSYGHAGFYCQNVGNNSQLTAGTSTTPATYEYNYVHVGDNTSDPGYDNTNLYDSLTFGIFFTGSNVKVNNNSLKNIRLAGLITGNGLNDIKIDGERSDNTNNRFYNCGFGLRVGGTAPYDAYDFTCSNADFTGVSTAGNVPLTMAMYLIFDGTHSVHHISGNRIDNYTNGVRIGYPGTVAEALKGYTHITKNIITGKTTASSTVNMSSAIEITDSKPSTSGAANGTLQIDSNDITGAAAAVYVYSASFQTNITGNTVMQYPYSLPVVPSAIASFKTPHLSVTKNYVRGVGNNCSPLAFAFGMQKVGKPSQQADISCNVAEDINAAFYCTDTSSMQITNNTIRRVRTGIWLAIGAVIGQQGGPCDPVDNHWEDDACGSCTGCAVFPGWNATGVLHTYAQGNNLSLSRMYVRSDVAYPRYTPTNNGAGGGNVYTFASGNLINAAAGGCTLAAPDNCSAAAKGAPIATVSETSNELRVFPNPGNGNITVMLGGIDGQPVHVRVMNAMGIQVYEHTQTFAGGSADMNLQHLAPGMYMLQLSGTGVKQTTRILIEK